MVVLRSFAMIRLNRIRIEIASLSHSLTYCLVRREKMRDRKRRGIEKKYERACSANTMTSIVANERDRIMKECA